MRTENDGKEADKGYDNRLADEAYICLLYTSISVVGIPILEKGVTLSMTSKKTAELDAPAPVYEEDQTLQPGEEEIVKAETKGSRWVTNMVTKKDGVVVSDEFFHNLSLIHIFSML